MAQTKEETLLLAAESAREKLEPDLFPLAK